MDISTKIKQACGQCKQFTRTRENSQDLCGAWEQPTKVDRQACGFYIPKHLKLFNEGKT
ncbi:hypothetical protein [Vibrio sp. 10N.286.49.B3]|uniref:hypothetical protein n=1 Tax=Vibrio sp. 10N.286.49.B3 TaxID=1880855 RepID=UPI0018E44384|nr:hypothetical protein [Vibrio sp. 10N.286.49.B3]